MDPDATLARIRELYNDEETYFDSMNTIISMFMDLDDWISNGGFLPKAWIHSEEE